MESVSAADSQPASADCAPELEPHSPEPENGVLPVAHLMSGVALASSLLWSSWGAVVDAGKALRASDVLDKVR